VDDLLDRQVGVISRAQALGYLSDKAIRHRAATKRWQQPHRSVFVTHNGPLGSTEWRWIALLAAGAGAVLAGLTALSVAGLRGYEDDAIHLLVPAARRPPRPPGVVVHRTTVLSSVDLAAADPPRTTPARSLVDAAQWAHSDRAAQAVVAAAFQQRLVIARNVDQVLTRLVRARRRQIVMEAVRDADGGAHSLAEIDFVRLCRKCHLPVPTRQVVRRDGTGRRRYLDALFEPWGVHVEVDGGQHMDPRHAWDDMRRQNELWIAGERILRFPAWTVRRDPIGVISQIRAALLAAGWRP